MARIPSELKWLAERRARVAHEWLTTKERARRVAERADELALDLEALDRAIQIRDARINPQSIAAINGWQGRYGARGALQNSIAAALQTATLAWTPATTIEKIICAHLGVVFEFPAERARWYANSFRKALRNLEAGGIIEQRPKEGQKSGVLGYWRIKQHRQPTLADLRANAAKLL